MNWRTLIKIVGYLSGFLSGWSISYFIESLWNHWAIGYCVFFGLASYIALIMMLVCGFCLIYKKESNQC
jgi:hypothetical protein